MCGLLLVQSAAGIDQDRVAPALALLHRRGPNQLRHWQQGSTQIWHSVLHVSGTGDYYHRAPGPDFCAFAGEIYNYRDWSYVSDSELMHVTVRTDAWQTKKFKGPQSWIYADHHRVLYATDPQGERHLYRYQDNHITVVASEVNLVLAIVNTAHDQVPYENKTWIMLERTPYRGVTKLEPGRLYVDHQDRGEIDSMFQWGSPDLSITLEDAKQEFHEIWNRVIDQVSVDEPSTLSFSGGIDSSLILGAMPELDLLALDMTGKDPNIGRLPDLLTDQQNLKLITLPVSVKAYAGAYLDMIGHTRMPAQSWSHVGKWLVAKHAGNRVIYTGAGADELFGGYTVYKTIEYDQSGSHSPYSACHDTRLWQRCLDWAQGDARQATLMLDYWHQIVGCDSPGLDRAAGAWSRETRNPFLHPDIMAFAMRLPWHLKVADHCKVFLRAVWSDFYDLDQLMPKQGFAGHANDSAAWMGVEYQPTGDRHRDWQHICQRSFYALSGTD